MKGRVIFCERGKTICALILPEKESIVMRLNLVSGASAPIEKLPNEMLGSIIKRMIPMDPGELATTFKALQNLSQTSKRIYSVMHSEYVNTLVIDTILHKHHDMPTYLFHRIGMASLRRYIRSNKLDQAFKLLSNIYSVILKSLRDTNRALRSHVHYFPLSRSKNNLLGPRNCLLLIGPCCYSQKVQVFHPFGCTSIISSHSRETGDLDFRAVVMISKVMIEFLHGSFEGIFEKKFSRDVDDFELLEVKSESECVEVSVSNRDEDQIGLPFHINVQAISRRDVESKKGGQQLIFSPKFFVFSCYKIQSLFGEVLPRNRGSGDKLRRIISEMLHFESSLDADAGHLEENLEQHLQTTIVDMLADHSIEDRDFVWTEMDMKRIAHI